MLPIGVAAGLLLVSGIWYTVLAVLSTYWERNFETPGRNVERVQERRTSRDRVSAVVGPVMLSVPSVVTLGLAIDGLAETRVVFYAHGWSWSLPQAGALQLLGAILVFIALPLFTSSVYLIEKYVYSRLPGERGLIDRGPYAYIRHPMHLGALLLGIGWILLSLNFVSLVLLFLLQGVQVARAEEPELVETYGEAYKSYQRRTGFFLPRLRRTAKK